MRKLPSTAVERQDDAASADPLEVKDITTPKPIKEIDIQTPRFARLVAYFSALETNAALGGMGDANKVAEEVSGTLSSTLVFQPTVTEVNREQIIHSLSAQISVCPDPEDAFHHARPEDVMLPGSLSLASALLALSAAKKHPLPSSKAETQPDASNKHCSSATVSKVPEPITARSAGLAIPEDLPRPSSQAKPAPPSHQSSTDTYNRTWSTLSLGSGGSKRVRNICPENILLPNPTPSEASSRPVDPYRPDIATSQMPFQSAAGGFTGTTRFRPSGLVTMWLDNVWVTISESDSEGSGSSAAGSISSLEMLQNASRRP